MRTLSILLAVAGATALAGPAAAVEPLDDIGSGQELAAAGDVAAWTDGRAVLIRRGAATPQRIATAEAPTSLDVARDARKRLTVVWVSRGKAYAVRPGGRPRVLAKLPPKTVVAALHGDRLVYARELKGCDVPFVRTLGRGAPRRLDRGTCSGVHGMDFDGRRIALLVGYDLEDENVSVTEARILRPSGGRAKVVTGEAASQEPRAVGGVALAGDRLITTLTGTNRTNVLTRHDLRTGRQLDARAFADLDGPVAVLGNRRVLYTTTSSDLEDELSCASCPLLSSEDPFTGSRRLPPTLGSTAPERSFLDEELAVTGRLTRVRVSRTTRLGTTPLPGRTVQVLAGDTAVATATTGADGRWRVAFPTPLQPFTIELAVRADGAAEEGHEVVGVARIAFTAERRPDGTARVTGTVAPPQPGRRVRLLRAGGGGRGIEEATTAALNAAGDGFDFTSSKVPAGRYTADLVATKPAGREAESAEVAVP